MNPGCLLIESKKGECHAREKIFFFKETFFIYTGIDWYIIFIFDRDYFNEIIAETDDINAFTLPCYSFENLLLDHFFLSQEIFKIPSDKINENLLEFV